VAVSPAARKPALLGRVGPRSSSASWVVSLAGRVPPLTGRVVGLVGGACLVGVWGERALAHVAERGGLALLSHVGQWPGLLRLGFAIGRDARLVLLASV